MHKSPFRNGPDAKNSTVTTSASETNTMTTTDSTESKKIQTTGTYGSSVIVNTNTNDILETKCIDTIPDQTYIIDKSQVFLTHRCLGNGAYGKVVKGYYFGFEVAVKFIEPRHMRRKHLNGNSSGHEEKMKILIDEVSVFTKVKSPNCVTFFGFSLDPPFLVTEYCPNGSLYNLIETARKRPRSKEARELLPWKKRLFLAIGIVEGIRYLHGLKDAIVHGDVKSPNILIDKDGNAKVTDFGLSCFIDRNHAETGRNSGLNPLWSSPEILENKSLTRKTDVYSFGIILWELLTFQVPFNIDSKDCHALHQIYYQIVQFDIRPEIPNNRNLLPGKWNTNLEEYINLIKDCWKREPDDRPDFDDILKRLSALKTKLYPTDAPSLINIERLGEISVLSEYFGFYDHGPRNTLFSILKLKLFCCWLIFLIILLSGWGLFLSILFTSCNFMRSEKCLKKNKRHYHKPNDGDGHNIIDDHNDPITKDPNLEANATSGANENDNSINDYDDDDDDHHHHGMSYIHPHLKDAKEADDHNLAYLYTSISISCLSFLLVVISTYLFYSYYKKLQKKEEVLSDLKELELESGEYSDDVSGINSTELVELKTMSKYFSLQLLDNDKPTREKWKQMRSIILRHLDVPESSSNRQYDGIKYFLKTNLDLKSTEDWNEFLRMIFAVPEITETDLWTHISKFFICQ